MKNLERKLFEKLALLKYYFRIAKSVYRINVHLWKRERRRQQLEDISFEYRLNYDYGQNGKCKPLATLRNKYKQSYSRQNVNVRTMQ